MGQGHQKAKAANVQAFGAAYLARGCMFRQHWQRVSAKAERTLYIGSTTVCRVGVAVGRLNSDAERRQRPELVAFRRRRGKQKHFPTIAGETLGRRSPAVRIELSRLGN